MKARRLIRVALLALFLTTVPISTVGALTADQKFKSNNNIRFYDRDFQLEAGASCNSAGFEDTGDNLKTIFLDLVKRGLSEKQAAGALGNISQETDGTGDPTIVQGGGRSTDPSNLKTPGNAYGIIQWDPGDRVIGYIEQYKISGAPSELSTQLEILWNHMNKDSPTGDDNMLGKAGRKLGVDYRAYKDIDNIDEATRTFHDRIEGSADATTEDRAAQAKNLYGKYKGLSTGSTATAATITSASNCGTSSEGNGSIVDLALEYSWPTQYKRGSDLRNPATMNPKYKAATVEAINNNEFTGGYTGQKGVDCGGFVTRVMRNSGVDPEYNSLGGFGGPTGARFANNQQKYLKTSGKYADVTSDKREPGDIGIRSGHTFIYVGANDKFTNGEVIAESSISMPRAPQAGWTEPTDSRYDYYRFIEKAI